MDPDAYLCQLAEIFNGISVNTPSLSAIIAIILAGLLLLASGFASASEIAFFSLSPSDLNDIEGQMIDDIGEDKYLQYKDELSDRFLQKAVKGENGFTYISEQIIEIIYSFKDGSHFSL